MNEVTSNKLPKWKYYLKVDILSKNTLTLCYTVLVPRSHKIMLFRCVKDGKSLRYRFNHEEEFWTVTSILFNHEEDNFRFLIFEVFFCFQFYHVVVYKFNYSFHPFCFGYAVYLSWGRKGAMPLHPRGRGSLVPRSVESRVSLRKGEPHLGLCCHQPQLWGQEILDSSLPRPVLVKDFIEADNKPLGSLGL